jgi:hypothetical protein
MLSSSCLSLSCLEIGCFPLPYADRVLLLVGPFQISSGSFPYCAAVEPATACHREERWGPNLWQLSTRHGYDTITNVTDTDHGEETTLFVPLDGEKPFPRSLSTMRSLPECHPDVAPLQVAFEVRRDPQDITRAYQSATHRITGFSAHGSLGTAGCKSGSCHFREDEAAVPT